jgi:amidase
MLKEKPLDYARAGAGELARALAARQVSALELCDAAIGAIEAMDGPINAVVVRDFGRARDAAKAADAALARGDSAPLLGVPMTVKEANHVAGLPTTWGVEAFRGWKASVDSTAVARLKGAGAVILGKTNVPPNLGDWQTANPIYGRTNNPFDLTRGPGGSSGGAAAALAAGMVPLELGSDIGGSIRVPSHMCGTFGHKPSWGLVPPTGHSPPPQTDRPRQPIQFNVVGPMARTAADLELALGVLAGPEGDDAVGYRLALPPPRATALKDFRVLVVTAHPTCATDEAVSGPIEALAERLSALGGDVAHESELLPDLAALHGVYFSMLVSANGRTSDAPRAPSVDTYAWLAGLDRIVDARAQWRALFERFDVVLAPAFGLAAYPHCSEVPFAERTMTVNGEATPYVTQLAWPGVASFPGLPSTCAPLARTAQGLPTGVQIIGPRFEDMTPLAFAGLLEREIGLL